MLTELNCIQSTRNLKNSSVSVGGVFSLLTGSYKKKVISGEGFVEKTDYEKGFSEHYNKYLKPQVDSYEQRRMKALNTASMRAKIAAPLLVVVVIAATFFGFLSDMASEGSAKGSLFFSGISLFGASMWVYSSINVYRSSIKSNIFPNIMSFLGDFRYSPQCPARVYAYFNSLIVPKFDLESNEDCIKGTYKGVGIDLFESHLQEEYRDSKGRTHYKTIFKGVVIDLTMHKKFTGHTVVKKDAGAVGNWFKSKFSSDLENVKLEDPRFEKIFEVYSTDQIEARYLLTTAFMDRMLKLVESFGGTNIECCFFDNRLLMMIPVRQNLFEPGSIFEAEDFVDDSKILLKEMHHLFGIIDILKLDLNIGI